MNARDGTSQTVPVKEATRAATRRKTVTSLGKRLMNEYHLYLIFLPVLIYYIIFRYVPIIGSVVLSVLDFNIFKGIAASPWVGMKHFVQFFDSIYFWRLLRNTLMINLLNLVFVFPMPILFALLMNEVRSKILKRSVQTISYLPHFVSTVIMASMAVTFLSPSIGFVNNLITEFGGERIAFLQKAEYFWSIYTVLDIWKTMGWSAILYFAALTGINSELYEAAMVDGASRWKQMLNITLPGILPTIIIMLLLKIGHMLDLGYEVILLLYNPSTYETADVINTYVYRKGVIEASYSFSSAVGLFQSVIGLILIVVANRLARKFSDSSMW